LSTVILHPFMLKAIAIVFKNTTGFLSPVDI